MSVVRPTVSCYDLSFKAPIEQLETPKVFTAPIRPDIVHFVHYNLAKNQRQAHGVKVGAGYGTSAESWGTGRAVSRIPRVPGGGTHRSGQAAFGNMCRGGGMFAPLKVWRRWHRHVNQTMRRHAVASAIAASAYQGLVLGRGHLAEDMPELPLVVDDKAETLKKTKQAKDMLKAAGLGNDIKRCNDSRRRALGKKKWAARAHKHRVGPLVIHANEDRTAIERALRTLPGVDTCHVREIHLRHIAPGGTLGRAVVWTKSAFTQLNEIYAKKSGYSLPRAHMTNPDIFRLINSDEVQAVARPCKTPRLKKTKKHGLACALKNRRLRCKLDPAYALKHQK